MLRNGEARRIEAFVGFPQMRTPLRCHLKRPNYLGYIMHNSSLKDHPSPVGNGWELRNGICRPARYSKPTLPDYLSQLDEGVGAGLKQGSHDSNPSSEGDNEYDDIDESSDE